MIWSSNMGKFDDGKLTRLEEEDDSGGDKPEAVLKTAKKGAQANLAKPVPKKRKIKDVRVTMMTERV